MRKILIFTFITIFSPNSYSILEFEDAVFPEFVTSARALAMGNAYMGKVDDGWSAFYNPAGLGTVRGMQFHLTNAHMELNNGFLDVASNGAFTDTLSNYTDAFDVAKLRDLHAEDPGHISHARFHLFPNITFRGLTLGYLYAQQNRARLRSLSDNYEIAERTDSGPVMALSMSLFGGIVKFGGSVVYLTRQELQKDFAPADSVSIDEDTDVYKGSMTHITAASRITLPYKMLPTLSAVLRNSSQTEFYDGSMAGAPESIPQTVDYSFSITPNLGRTLRMHLEVARKDAGDRYDKVSAQRKTLFGIEFDYLRQMFVRFGYGDGWGTAGVGVRNKDFTFDLSTYAIEASTDGFREEEDRRFALSFSSGF